MAVDPARLTSAAPKGADLTCPCCLDIPLRPVALPCEHLFCPGCIQHALDMHPKCPVCSAPSTDDMVAPVPRIVQNIISALSVRCLHCPAEVTLENLEVHERQCNTARPETPAQEIHALLAPDLVRALARDGVAAADIAQLLDSEESTVRSMLRSLGCSTRSDTELESQLQQEEAAAARVQNSSSPSSILQGPHWLPAETIQYEAQRPSRPATPAPLRWPSSEEVIAQIGLYLTRDLYLETARQLGGVQGAGWQKVVGMTVHRALQLATEADPTLPDSIHHLGGTLRSNRGARRHVMSLLRLQALPHHDRRHLTPA